MYAQARLHFCLQLERLRPVILAAMGAWRRWWPMALTHNAQMARAPDFVLIRFFLTDDPAVRLDLLLYLILRSTGWQMLLTRMARGDGALGPSVR